MKLNQIAPTFVSSFPAELEPGILYASTKFSTAAHLCACGCENEVITPLSPAHWRLMFDGTVTLEPSIGNWSLPCQSHYYIDHGQIRWARDFSSDEIRRNRESDARLLEDARRPATRSRWRRLKTWFGRH